MSKLADKLRRYSWKRVKARFHCKRHGHRQELLYATDDTSIRVCQRCELWIEVPVTTYGLVRVFWL